MNESRHVYVETPIGPVAIWYQLYPFRLLSIDLTGSSDNPSGQGGALNAGDGGLQAVAGLIRSYFEHRPIDVPWSFLAMDHLTLLQQQVLYETAQIPYGALKTYKRVAEAIGRPRAYRFVGSALGKNPFPLIIPCHRVIRNNGCIGDFTAGPEIKQWLIDFESAKPSCLQL